MAELAAARPMRLPVSVATGARIVLTAGATEAGGQHSLTLAIIAGGFVVAGSVAGPIVTELVRQKRQRPATDVTTAQADLLSHIVDHFSAELAERDTRLAECRDELARLKRRRRA